LPAANATQVIAQAGFYSMFFFVTLYMQNVPGFSPIEAGTAYIPVTIGVGLATGIASKLLPRTGPGFHYALVACSIFLIVVAAIATRAANAQNEPASNLEELRERAALPDAA
jgi:predicted MFS family arabinose efflux permease